MRFRVYLLRHRGRRLAWREVVNGPSYAGDLVSEQVTVGEEQLSRLTLRCNDPVVPAPIPALYQPTLLSFSPLALRLRGFERVERGSSIFGVVQEWHCELP